MKTFWILSVVTSFAMICSCQKQDSAAEQQLAQPKAKLDAHEKALDERMNALDQRVNVLNGMVNALAEKQKAMANVRTIPPDPQTQISDPAQAQAERDAAIQQFFGEIRARVPEHSRVPAGDPAKRERAAPQQLGPEDLQRQWQQNLDKAKMSGGASSPAIEATSPIPSPRPE
jgi:hypothetical protein